MRIKGIFLQVLVAVLIAAGMRVTANADTIEGKCGTNCWYSYNTDTKEMVISGTGAIMRAPWSKASGRSYFHEIEKVTIKDGITALKTEYAFVNTQKRRTYYTYKGCEGCKGLKTVHMAKSVKEISKGAFYGCGNLKTLTIPGVEIIGEDAFAGCYKLSGVKFSKNIKYIGTMAFRAVNLKGKLVIKKGVYYGYRAFGEAKSLKKVTYEEGIKYIKCIADGKNLESIELPESAVKIDSWAFADLEKIKTITLPSNVKKIGEYAFWNLQGMKKIVIKSKKITAIGDYAFSGLKNTDIYVPEEKYSKYKKLIRDSFIGDKNDFKNIRIIKY